MTTYNFSDEFTRITQYAMRLVHVTWILLTLSYLYGKAPAYQMTSVSPIVALLQLEFWPARVTKDHCIDFHACDRLLRRLDSWGFYFYFYLDY